MYNQYPTEAGDVQYERYMAKQQQGQQQQEQQEQEVHVDDREPTDPYNMDIL